jgi:hypothetical protein
VVVALKLIALEITPQPTAAIFPLIFSFPPDTVPRVTMLFPAPEGGRRSALPSASPVRLFPVCALEGID